jgi:hypothetical protein
MFGATARIPVQCEVAQRILIAIQAQGHSILKHTSAEVDATSHKTCMAHDYACNPIAKEALEWSHVLSRQLQQFDNVLELSKHVNQELLEEGTTD